MDRVKYAGHSILTGTAIAEALLAYAQALTDWGASVTVEVPSVQSDGTIERALFLIGPHSQLVSESEPSDFDDPEDSELVTQFTHETQLLGTRHAIAAEDSGSSMAQVDDLDLPSQ